MTDANYVVSNYIREIDTNYQSTVYEEIFNSCVQVIRKRCTRSKRTIRS